MSGLARRGAGPVVLACAGGLIWFGSDLLSIDDAQTRSGGFTLVTTGLLLLTAAGVAFIHNFLKSRAPARPGERAAEPEEVEFDADAVIERYLATRKALDPGFSPARGRKRRRAPVPVRRNFGRRGDPA
jgi:hypothetical protein